MKAIPFRHMGRSICKTRSIAGRCRPSRSVVECGATAPLFRRKRNSVPHSKTLPRASRRRSGWAILENRAGPESIQSAFTIVEVLAILAVMIVVAAVLLASVTPRRATSKAVGISCVNNFKEVGTAYRLWANDHGDLVPPQQSISNGG